MKRPLVFVAALAGLTLTACSSSSDHSSTHRSTVSSAAPSATSTAISSVHNAADIMFAQMMAPHHAQAVEMASKAATEGKSSQVRAIAARIRAAQGPEVVRLGSMLSAWGADTNGHQEHSMPMKMPGMMSASQMAAYLRSSGAALDRMFATMMIAHHQGAITMARDEQANGRNRQAKALAASIEKTQSAEITQLQSLLSTLP